MCFSNMSVLGLSDWTVWDELYAYQQDEIRAYVIYDEILRIRREIRKGGDGPIQKKPFRVR